MRSGSLFSRLGYLASCIALGVVFTPVGLERPARADALPPIVAPAPSASGGVFAKFWLATWGTPDPGGSAVPVATPVPGGYEIEALVDGRPVARANLDAQLDVLGGELPRRLRAGGHQVADARASVRIVAGTVDGGHGPVNVAAFVIEMFAGLAARADATTSVHVLAPFHVGDDAEAALEAAEAMVVTMSADAGFPGQGAGMPESSGDIDCLIEGRSCECLCLGQYGNDLRRCARLVRALMMVCLGEIVIIISLAFLVCSVVYSLPPAWLSCLRAFFRRGGRLVAECFLAIPPAYAACVLEAKLSRDACLAACSE